MNRCENDSMIGNSVEVSRHAVHGDFEEDCLGTIPHGNQ
jgi:hypothetical protein